MQIVISGLGKDFASYNGPVVALDNINIDIKKGEFYTLLGPSGCGKSTTLRCIAGLENPDRGEIRIGSTVVAGRNVLLPPNKRPIGMVFQSYAIWPHMTVFNNVAFPIAQGERKVPAPERRRRVMEVLSLMQMEHLADRPAPFLSGGQQQRVALARAMISSSEVLLLDEPLSNLDAKLREDLRVEIKELTKRLGITAVYVTHDQTEALAMSDRIAVMLGGKIIQEATPHELYTNPVNAFVAEFVGRVNLIPGTVKEKTADGAGRIETALGSVVGIVSPSVQVGDTAVVAIRPESISLAKDESARVNVFDGVVQSTMFLGEANDCTVVAAGMPMLVKLPASAHVAEGSKVALQFSAEAAKIIPKHS